MSDRVKLPITFRVNGKPAPGGSKKVVGTTKTGKPLIVDAAKGNASWRRKVANAARAQVGDASPVEGVALKLTCVFRLIRPKSHHVGGDVERGWIKTSAPHYPTIRPDSTKLLRAVEDALTGIIWKDDAQICLQVVSKGYINDANPLPGVYIRIEAFA